MEQLRPVSLLAAMVISRTESGVVVYDTSTHTIHAMPALLVQLLELCDGTRSVSDLSRAMVLVSGADFGIHDVTSALADLRWRGLVSGCESLPMSGRRARRTMSRRSVSAALAGAAIVSVSAPLAASAESHDARACNQAVESASGCFGCCGFWNTPNSPQFDSMYGEWICLNANKAVGTNRVIC